MKKVLIISYFFPPANFAGSYRVLAWARYLYKFGYYPTIVTRQWNANQTDSFDVITDNTLKHEKHEHYEVYFVPVEYMRRELIVQRFPRLKQLARILTAIELLLRCFVKSFYHLQFLYEFSLTLIQKEKDFKLLYITGNPFEIYKIGYLLHKKTSIKWIADYRDGWTIWNKYNTNGFFRIVGKIEAYYENKWMKTVSAFTTVNEELVKGISNLINKKGYKIMNGFMPEDYTIKEVPDFTSTIILERNAINLVYNGTLYHTQILDVFFDGLRMYRTKYPTQKVHLYFIGILHNNTETEKLKEKAKGIEDSIILTPRISKSEVIHLQKLCDAFLFFTHGNLLKGSFPSKMFEYFALKKPILVSPDDNGVVTDLIQTTNTGYVTSDPQTIIKWLELLSRKSLPYHADEKEVSKYTRENQTKSLAEVFDRYLNNAKMNND